MKTKILLATATLCSGAWIGSALAQSSGGSGAGASSSGAAGTTGATGTSSTSSSAGTATTAAPTGTPATPTGRLSTPTGTLSVPTGEVGTPATTTTPSRSILDTATPSGALAPQSGTIQPQSALPSGISTAPAQPGVSPLTGLPRSQFPTVSAGTDPVGPNPGTAQGAGSTAPRTPTTANRGAIVPAGAESLPSAGPNNTSRPGGVTRNSQMNIPANARSQIFVANPPPAPISETISTAPDANHVWVPGGYIPSAGGWTWMSGTWQRPPVPGARWVPGSYDAATQRWTGGYWDTSETTPSSSSSRQ